MNYYYHVDYGLLNQKMVIKKNYYFVVVVFDYLCLLLLLLLMVLLDYNIDQNNLHYLYVDLILNVMNFVYGINYYYYYYYLIIMTMKMYVCYTHYVYFVDLMLFVVMNLLYHNDVMNANYFLMMIVMTM